MFAPSRVHRRLAGFVFLFGLISLFGATFLFLMPVAAQTAPTLGTAASFEVLGGSTVTNTGPSVVNADLGVSPGTAITGFPPGTVNGTIYTADAVALQAQNDLTTAYNSLAGQSPCTDLSSQDLGGLTLTEGVYCFSSTAQLTGTLTLDAQSNAAAVFIFQIGSALTTASNSAVVVENGGTGCNVWWQVGSSATLGTTTAFEGNILALQDITLTTGATLLPGRALARNGAVTMDSNTIDSSACFTPSPGLSVSVDDGGGTETQGGTISYTISYQNTGNVALNSVTLSDVLPANTTFNAGASTPGWNTGGSPLTFDLGSLLPGETGSKVFAVTVDNPTSVTEISNSVTIASGATNATGGDTTSVTSPAVPTSAPSGATAVPALIFTAVPTEANANSTTNANGQGANVGVPNTGGGPPQPTYWITEQPGQ